MTEFLPEMYSDLLVVVLLSPHQTVLLMMTHVYFDKSHLYSSKKKKWNILYVSNIYIKPKSVRDLCERFRWILIAVVSNLLERILSDNAVLVILEASRLSPHLQI